MISAIRPTNHQRHMLSLALLFTGGCDGKVDIRQTYKEPQLYNIEASS